MTKEEATAMSMPCDDAMIKITSELKALPPVAPKPKTGKWNLEIEDWNKWTCSNCGWEKRTDIHVRLGYKYCPNCGAKMIEPQERSDKE